MKKFIYTLFNDSNTINEKSVVGFLAFLMLIITLVADIISGLFGRTMPIHEFIFDGFVIIVLGAFGIASIDKWINKGKSNKSDTETP